MYHRSKELTKEGAAVWRQTRRHSLPDCIPGVAVTCSGSPGLNAAFPTVFTPLLLHRCYNFVQNPGSQLHDLVLLADNGVGVIVQVNIDGFRVLPTVGVPKLVTIGQVRICVTFKYFSRG